MSDARLIEITARYEPSSAYGRSLGWIAPELNDAHLTLVEDKTNDGMPSRTWGGIVDGLIFNRLAEAWHLTEYTTETRTVAPEETGPEPPRSYVFDGMNWERDGDSPITSVTLKVFASGGADGAAGTT
jgi:hypothetical protein